MMMGMERRRAELKKRTEHGDDGYNAEEKVSRLGKNEDGDGKAAKMGEENVVELFEDA